MAQIYIGDDLFIKSTNRTGKVKAVTHKHVLLDVYDRGCKIIGEELLLLEDVIYDISIGVYKHYPNSHKTVIPNNKTLEHQCNHEWRELTLFTSTITICYKCDKKK